MTQDEMEQMLQALGRFATEQQALNRQLSQVGIAQQALNAQMVEQTGLLTRALSRIEARLQSMEETLKGLLPQRRTNGGTQNA
jgi:flagellar capping protein FliD